MMAQKPLFNSMLAWTRPLSVCTAVFTVLNTRGGKGRLRWFEYHSYNGLKGSEQLACCRLKCCTFHLRGKRFSLETCSVLSCLIKVDRGRVKIITSLIACIGAKVPHVLYPHLLGSRFCVALRVSGSKGFCKNAQCTFVKLKHIFGAERMCGAVLGSFCIGCLLWHISLEPAKGIANISAKQLGFAWCVSGDVFPWLWTPTVRPFSL